MVNALLVYPKIPRNTYWSFYYSMSFINKEASHPPLGIITVASMLPRDYNLKLIDENVEPLKDDDLKWADIVLTSSMIIQSDSLEDVIKRASNFHKPVVAGGPFPTQYYDDARLKGVDYFVLGEAESGVLHSFIADFEQGKAKRVYARQVIRKNRELSQQIDTNEWNRLKEFFKEDIEIVDQRPTLEASPVPRYDLLKVNSYSSMAIQFSRGCPFNCDFCNEPALFGNVPRIKSGHQIVDELDVIRKLGYTGSVFFVDDNFIGNVKKVKEALHYIIDFQTANKYPFSFYTEASINLAKDEELMALMRDAGFNMVFVGIETPSKAALEKMGKGQNLKADFVNDVKKINSYGMEVTAGLIVGLDEEPDDATDKIFELCQEAGIPTAMAGLLVVARGSELYERMKKEGRLIEKVQEGNNTYSFELNYVPDRNRTIESVVESYKQLLARLYDKDGRNYFARCRTMLHNIVPGSSFARPVKWDELYSFANSVARQFFFKSYSSNYRKFIADTIFHRTKLFSEAIRLGIMGHHLIKISQDALKAEAIHTSIEEKIAHFRRVFEEKKVTSKRKLDELMAEKDEFLKKARRRIKHLPEEYRAKLSAAYERFKHSK